MAKVDVEVIMDAIGSELVNQLNTRIAAMNTEKGGTALPTVDNNAYFQQTLDDRVANYDPFLVYGVTSVETRQEIDSASWEDFTISVNICFHRQVKDLTTAKMAYRYNRILKELFSQAWDRIKPGFKFYVTSIEPVPFTLADSSRAYMATGVDLRIGLG